MEKNLLLILVIVLLAYSADSQNVIQTLDFMNEKDALQEISLKHKEKVRIKIENINRNVFKVEDSFKEKEFNATPPAAFTGIKLPGFIGAATTLVEAFGILNNKSAEPKKVDTLALYLTMLQFYSQKIDSAVYLNNHFINLATNCQVRFSRVEFITDSLINDYTDFRRNGDSHDSYAFSLKEYLNNLIEGSLGVGEMIQGLINTRYGSKVPADIAAAKAAAEKTLEDIRTFAKENKIEDLIKNYNKLSEPYFTYFTKPVKPKKDEVEIDINITSDRLNCVRNVPVNYNQTYKVRRGVKVDFSTGIFFSRGKNDFIDKELEYIPAKNDSVTITDKNANNKTMVSIGALAHIYWRSSGWLNFALSPGVSTTLDIATINIHLGVSALIGRENRAVVTFGPVIKQSTIVRKPYEFNKTYLTKLMPEAPPSEKKFPAAGWFLSLTYNISKLQKG